MTDTLLINKSYRSDVAALLAHSRRPYIAVRVSDSTSMPFPVVRTDRGAIFHYPAVLDFLLHRITAPEMLDGDPVRRGMQWTVFWSLDAAWDKLMVARRDELTAWLEPVIKQLQANPFYAGPVLSICDINLVCLLENLMHIHGFKHEVLEAYVKRIARLVEDIVDTNKQELQRA